MKIIGKRKTDAALLVMRNQRITDVKQSLRGTISIDTGDLKRWARWGPKGSKLRGYRGGYGKIGKFSLFVMAAPWSISRANGSGILKDTSPYKRIEQGLDALLGKRITGISFNGKAPMFTFEIEGGVTLRVFAEMDEYYPGWDFSARRLLKRQYYDYREEPPYEP